MGIRKERQTNCPLGQVECVSKCSQLHFNFGFDVFELLFQYLKLAKDQCACRDPVNLSESCQCKEQY